MIQVGGEQGWGKNVTERQQKERRGQYNHMYLCTYENDMMKLITCVYGGYMCAGLYICMEARS